MGALLSSARCQDYVDFPLFLFVYRILRYSCYWMLSRFLFYYCIPILVISLYWIKKKPINLVLHESFWLAINPSLQPNLYRFSLHETISPRAISMHFRCMKPGWIKKHWNDEIWIRSSSPHGRKTSQVAFSGEWIIMNYCNSARLNG